MAEKIAIVLAAGEGKRIKSDVAKVLHPLCGVPILHHVLNRLTHLRFARIFVIVGHQAQQVRESVALYDVTCVLQSEQRGTGHAVLQAQNALSGVNGSVLIVNGDAPLLSDETIMHLWETHHLKKETVTLLTALLPSAAGYGRIIRDDNGNICNVVESADATPEELRVHEINAGAYVVDLSFLFPTLSTLTSHNQQNEIYLTDIVRAAVQKGISISYYQTPSTSESLGINSRRDLARAEAVLQQHIVDGWMDKGVTIIDPNAVRIEATVTIGRDVVLYPGVILEGHTHIGSGTVLYPCRIRDSHLAERVVVRDSCVIDGADIASDVSVGPFAHLRPGTQLHSKSRVGNFVEIKKSKLGAGSKANHLSYIGDADIGKNVNIGAGTITCNYDGIQKHQTRIDDDAFIGSGTQLVAPVHVGVGTVIGAGSTVTKDVPPQTLAIARARQTHLPKRPKRP